MSELLRFLGQSVRHVRTVGAVWPSGQTLARIMTDGVGPVGLGELVVELGPGTGRVTAELVRRFGADRVVAVERLAGFADQLATDFPGVTVIQGDAAELPAHLDRLGIDLARVAAVVSGLPLLVLPDGLPARVLGAVASVLRPGRRFVQFTYSGRAWQFATPGLTRIDRRRVWRNIPPAVVLTFERTEP